MDIPARSHTVSVLSHSPEIQSYNALVLFDGSSLRQPIEIFANGTVQSTGTRLNVLHVPLTLSAFAKELACHR